MTYFNIIKLDATESSNDWLKERFNSGDCSDGDLVWVRNQTQGRGQRNKHWKTEPMKNLTFSLFKYFTKLTIKEAFAINCAITLSITKALLKFEDLDIKLKWPNDILSGNSKIGGILIENIIKGNLIKASIIGIGVNINQEYFEGLPNASSLFQKKGYKTEIADVLNGILVFLEVYLDRISDEGSLSLRLEYEDLLFQKGKISTFKKHNEEFQGIILGVTENGLLRIRKISGEVFDYASGTIEMIY